VRVTSQSSELEWEHYIDATRWRSGGTGTRAREREREREREEEEGERENVRELRMRDAVAG